MICSQAYQSKLPNWDQLVWSALLKFPHVCHGGDSWLLFFTYHLQIQGIVVACYTAAITTGGFVWPFPFRMHKISRASLDCTVQRSEVSYLRQGCWLRDVPSWMCGMSADSQPSIWLQDEVMWQCCDYCWRRQCWLVEGPGWSVSGWRLLLNMVKIRISTISFRKNHWQLHLYIYIYTILCTCIILFSCAFSHGSETKLWSGKSDQYLQHGETVELLLFDGNLLVYHHL